MEAEFPSNSHRPKKSKDNVPADKKVEKVVQGTVSRRKKSLGKKFEETFISGDAQSVGGYVLWDVVIPAAKDTIADAVSQGIERMLFGEARSSSRRGGSSRSGSAQGFVNYSRFGSGGTRRDNSPPQLSRRARASHAFDEIVIDNRGEAEGVIDGLEDLIGKYGSASVSDLYDLIGTTGNFTDEKWGWTNLEAAGVSRVRSGYLLNLPRPEPLD